MSYEVIDYGTDPQFGVARVTRTKDEAREAYTKMSKWYDWMTVGSERKFTDAGLRQFDAKKGEKLLEIGFGTGHAMVSLAKDVGPTGMVHGIDIADGMLELATQRLEKEGLSGRCRLHRGDAVKILRGGGLTRRRSIVKAPGTAITPSDILAASSAQSSPSSSPRDFPDGTFDGVFMSFVLELFDTPEIPRVLCEVRRVLKPGGRVTIVALMKKPNKKSVAVYEWFHNKMPKMVDCRPINIRGAVEEIPGFSIVTLGEQAMWGLPVSIMTAVACTEENTCPVEATLQHQQRRDPASSGPSSHRQSPHVGTMSLNADVNEPQRREGENSTSSGDTGSSSIPTTPTAPFVAPKQTTRWVSDSHRQQCVLCHKPFNPLFRRRHHCRKCGEVVCGACSKQNMALQKTTLKTPKVVPPPAGTRPRAATIISAMAALNEESVRTCNQCFKWDNKISPAPADTPKITGDDTYTHKHKAELHEKRLHPEDFQQEDHIEHHVYEDHRPPPLKGFGLSPK